GSTVVWVLFFFFFWFFFFLVNFFSFFFFFHVTSILNLGFSSLGDALSL
ncbi:hypothetical protein Nmel_017867, partial [Mimus melanotis]